MGEATLRKMRCRQDTRRGVTGVPPAFSDSLLHVDEVLFLPSPSLQKANKQITCKDCCVTWFFTTNWKHKPFPSPVTGKQKPQEHGAMRQQARWSPRPQPSHEKLPCFYSFHIARLLSPNVRNRSTYADEQRLLK